MVKESYQTAVPLHCCTPTFKIDFWGSFYIRQLKYALDNSVKIYLRQFSAVLVTITHAGRSAVPVLSASPLQTILNIIEPGVVGSCIISFILIKKFNQMDFLLFETV